MSAQLRPSHMLLVERTMAGFAKLGSSANGFRSMKFQKGIRSFPNPPRAAQTNIIDLKLPPLTLFVASVTVTTVTA
jgi:hypothetical protein